MPLQRTAHRRRSCHLPRHPPSSRSAAGAALLVQAWSPIGGITSYRGDATRSTFTDPVIVDIGERYGKSAAQVMLSWHLQQRRSAIPKSVRPARIAENLDVFDFELSSDELAAIDPLDTGVRGGPEPEVVTLETFGRVISED